MQTTRNINGHQITIHARRRHSRGNFIGWAVTIGENKEFYGVLTSTEAINKALIKYIDAMEKAAAAAATTPVSEPAGDAEPHPAAPPAPSPSTTDDVQPPVTAATRRRRSRHEVNREFLRIAQDVCAIETLAERGRDALDFHHLSVRQIAELLNAAYELGRASE